MLKPTPYGQNSAGGRRGFTLIELMVVVFLISTMLFLAVPKIQGTLLIDENRRASLWIMNRVQVLKQEAVRAQKDHRLYFDLDSNKIWSSVIPGQNDDTDKRPSEYVLPETLEIRDIEYIRGRKRTKSDLSGCEGSG